MNNEKLKEIFTGEAPGSFKPEGTMEVISTTENVLPAALESVPQSDVELYIEQELKDTIQELNDGAAEIKKIAEISEHPRAFEVYSTLLKTKIDALKELSANEANKKKQQFQQANTIHNTQVNVTQGTNINEILKALENKS